MLKFIILVASLLTVGWGAPQFSAGGRIVGGENTTIEMHPYMVSLILFNEPTCGGTIISPTWVLTAAHCITGISDMYYIRAGSTFRDSGGEVIPAARVIPHPNFSWSSLDYDVGLIQLSHPITHPVARNLSLAEDGATPAAGTNAIVTGWGRLWEGGPMSDILQVVQVPIVSQADCRAAYGQSGVTDRMLCAGLLRVGGKGACHNDYGGPLIANGALTGIVSWGIGCARPDAPGVYASVPAVRAWIRQHSGI